MKSESSAKSIVLITGANGFLGQYFCEELLKRKHTVIATDIQSTSTFNPQKNINFNYFPLDVTQELKISKLLSKLMEMKLVPNTLVNNAAINPQVSQKSSLQEFSRLENFSLDSFRAEVAVGLEGAILCSKVFGEAMNRNGKGNIVNISSDLGIISPDQRLYQKQGIDAEKQPVKPVSYSVIKHGLLGLTKYLATYWPNVRCNALCPGGVQREQPAEFLQNIEALIPLHRMAQPTEVAAALSFLVSEDSSYMNGGNLVIDGGRSIW